MGMIDTLDALYRETTPGEWETRFYRDGKTIAVPSGYLIPHENCLSSADLCFIVEMRRNWPEIRDRLRDALRTRPEGTVVVPSEATQEMIDAGANTINRKLDDGKQAALVYRHMIAEHQRVAGLGAVTPTSHSEAGQSGQGVAPAPTISKEKP